MLLALQVLAAPPGAQKGLLHEILGLLEGAEHPVAVDVDLVPVAFGKLGELLLSGDHRT